MDPTAMDPTAMDPRRPGASFSQPVCDAGLAQPASTSLKWGADGELTALDLHHVLARLCVHDPQACRALDDAAAPSA